MNKLLSTQISIKTSSKIQFPLQRTKSLQPNKDKTISLDANESLNHLITKTQKNFKVRSPSSHIRMHERPLSFSSCSISLSDLLPPKAEEDSNKKTLVLDLDETLVHSEFTPFIHNDIILNITYEYEWQRIFVLIRPGAREFIKEMAKIFEVVIFTASLSNYAAPLLDIIDKEGNCSYRLYREHCTQVNGTYVKDLKRLNRNLRDVIIIDNLPLAYAFNHENGIPIKTWYDDKEDRELYKIIPILMFLSEVYDVRKLIPKMVEHNKFSFFSAHNAIKNYNINMKKEQREKGKYMKVKRNTDLNVGKSNNNIITNREINIKTIINEYNNINSNFNLNKENCNNITGPKEKNEKKAVKLVSNSINYQKNKNKHKSHFSLFNFGHYNNLAKITRSKLLTGREQLPNYTFYEKQNNSQKKSNQQKFESLNSSSFIRKRRNKNKNKNVFYYQSTYNPPLYHSSSMCSVSSITSTEKCLNNTIAITTKHKEKERKEITTQRWLKKQHRPKISEKGIFNSMISSLTPKNFYQRLFSSYDELITKKGGYTIRNIERKGIGNFKERLKSK